MGGCWGGDLYQTNESRWSDAMTLPRLLLLPGAEINVKRGGGNERSFLGAATRRPQELGGIYGWFIIAFVVRTLRTPSHAGLAVASRGAACRAGFAFFAMAPFFLFSICCFTQSATS